MAVRTTKKTAKKTTKSVVKKSSKPVAIPSTTIDGKTFMLSSMGEVENAICDCARASGYGKFDVKDLATGTTVSAAEIKIGGAYNVVPRAVMGC